MRACGDRAASWPTDESGVPPAREPGAERVASGGVLARQDVTGKPSGRPDGTVARYARALARETGSGGNQTPARGDKAALHSDRQSDDACPVLRLKVIPGLPEYQIFCAETPDVWMIANRWRMQPAVVSGPTWITAAYCSADSLRKLARNFRGLPARRPMTQASLVHAAAGIRAVLAEIVISVHAYASRRWVPCEYGSNGRMLSASLRCI
jgi:hypothetical protein